MIRNNNKEDSNNQDYLSLQEATKFCSYSQEYLSLRARQGKLKALKFGKNWLTKKEWLQEYQKGVEDYNNQIKNKKSQPAPPANLPIKRLFEIKFSFKDVRPTLTATLVIVLIIAGVVFEKESLIRTYNDLSPYAEEIGEAGDLFIEDVTQFSDDFFVATVNYQDSLKLLSNVFGEYGRWVKNQTLKH